MKPIALLIVALLAYQSANADCESATGPFRKCYDKSNAPPALIYRIFVRQLFRDSLEVDEQHRVGLHFVEAGLTPNMNSDDVIQYFVSRFLAIEKEVEETQKRTLCVDGRPRYEGAENFVVFNQMEEVSLSIYEKHLLIARSDLSASGLFDLDEALREYPGSFTAMFMDHQVAHNGSVLQIVKVATTLCGKPWGHQFTSSRSLTKGDLGNEID